MLVQHFGTHSDHFQKCVFPVLKSWHLLEARRSYSCTKAQSLNRHMLTHSGEKPFACIECNNTFTTTGNLKQHMMLHSGEKPFRCDQCNYSCTQAQNLKSRKLKHTAEKPFVCKQNVFWVEEAHEKASGKNKYTRKRIFSSNGWQISCLRLIINFFWLCHLVVFVFKLFSTNKHCLQQNRPRLLSQYLQLSHSIQIRWHHQHQFKIWPPGGATSIVLLTLSAGIFILYTFPFFRQRSVLN